MNIKATIFHFALMAHYGYGIYVYVFKIIAPPEIAAHRSSFGGPFKYLTFLNMILQFSYFSLALLNDLVGSNTQDFKRSSKLQKIRDFIFVTIVLSIGIFVTSTFWVIWHIDRDLIFPKIFDSFFPRWLNHNIHTMPMIGVLLELWLCPHAYPGQHKGFFTVASFVMLYALWICFIAYKTDYWVYPILQKLPNIGRAAFICGMAILAYIFYMAGEAINKFVWGTTAKKTKKHQ